MKILFLAIASILFYSQASAVCIMGRFGKDCPVNNKNKGNQINIYNGSQGFGPPYAATNNNDGGFLRKREAGDKSQNQGYADYKKHFVYYGYDFYAVPHQDGYHKSAETGNRTVAYEYAFNPFISVKGQRSELVFKGLSGESEMTHEHLMALLNLRLYLLDNFVIRSGIGFGRAKINASSDEERFNYDAEGSTEVLQFSANYLFGNENTLVGISTTTVQGVSGNRNLGMSSYSLNAGMGF